LGEIKIYTQVVKEYYTTKLFLCAKNRGASPRFGI